MSEKVAILGAGIAGLAAGELLRKKGLSSIIYEKENTFGGLCNSFTVDGFTFDTFGHISFDKQTREWLEDRTAHYVHEPEALNYDQGRWLRHPVQNNLYGLPIEERVELIKGFIEKPSGDDIDNYGDWLQHMYGVSFAKRYPYKYTRKYWTVEPEQLEIKWVKGRMYEPSIEEVLRGAMTSETPGVHYSKEAHYPQKGGFKAFLEPLAKECDIKYAKQVNGINTVEKKITFSDGSSTMYESLISTIPLIELCQVIKDIPVEIKDAASHLRYTTGVMVSLGFNKTDISPALWYYIYDEDILPARIYAPDWKSQNNVPQGFSAIQAEIYFSDFRPLKESLESIKQRVIKQMLTMGLFKEEDIIVQDVRMQKYANIIFTPEIYEARRVIHDYLDSKQIYYAGRFGEWDYLWTGQSLMSGRRAAEQCIKERG